MSFIESGQSSIIASRCSRRAWAAKKQHGLDNNQQSAYYYYLLMQIDRALSGRPLAKKPTASQLSKGMVPELADLALIEAGEILLEHIAGSLEQSLKAADTLLVAHDAVDRVHEIVS